MMKVRYIAIGVIVIVAIVVGVRLTSVSTDTSEDSSDTPSDVTLINFQYEKPEWLEGHLKQGSIEEYIKKRKKEITDGAIDLRQEFPNSPLLPFDLDITVDRAVLDEYESILITEREYTGGAHGNMQYIYYNLHNGKYNAHRLSEKQRNIGTATTHAHKRASSARWIRGDRKL